jgi:hypothetical protein
MAKHYFNMIRFIRLLFYHIYIYYDKTEKGGKFLTKFSTFAVFIVIFSLLLINIYNLILQYHDDNYTSLSGNTYVIICVILGIVMAYYLAKEEFNDFNKYTDYNKKYYLYFFIIVLLTLLLIIYTSNISRTRIFKQRAELQKEILSH